ncbi:MAG: RNA-directed DNA polymerase, partial [Bacteroidales bacterium]
SEQAEFSWGNKSSYRKYFQDYRSFLARPRRACLEAANGLSTKQDLYVISLDIKSFFDQIDINALITELEQVMSNHCRQFSLPESQRPDNRFWERVALILNWRWHEDDQEKVSLFNEDKEKLPLGLPQGLMASGFFANAYMLGFDAAMKQLIGSVILEDESVTLKDYCRYVDDLRLVVAAPRQYSGASQDMLLVQLGEFVTQQLREHCKRIGARPDKPLELSTDKSKITAYKAGTKSGSLSNMMETLNAELSGTFDFKSLTQAAGGLEGLLWMAEQIEAVEPIHSRLQLSAIAAPPSEVRDDTLKRFVASRLAQSLRHRLAMTTPGDTGGDDEVLKGLVVEGRAVAHEFEAAARKLIKCWAENPALALLLRTGLDLFPHPRLLLPVLEALSVKLLKKTANDSLDHLRQIHAAEYVAADLFRAGCQETGFRPMEEYPDGVDIAGYREELAAFAQQLLRERGTPWYLLQQAALYLAVIGDFSQITSVVMNSPELCEHKRLMQAMCYEPISDGELLSKLPVALVAQQIAPNSRRFGRWLQDALKRTFDDTDKQVAISMVAMNRPDLLEHILFSRSRSASEWKMYAPPTMRERKKKSTFFLSKQRASSISLFTIIQSPDNPFQQENGLLLLAKAILLQDGVAELLSSGLAITDIHIVCSDWSQILSLPQGERFLDVKLDKPETEPGYLYKKPEWVADDKAWLYGLGRILRSAMTGEPDFTARRFVLTEEPTRYRGLASSWFGRRIGLNQARSPLGCLASYQVCCNGLVLTFRQAYQIWR